MAPELCAVTPIAEFAAKHDTGSVPATVGVAETVCAPFMSPDVPLETELADADIGAVLFSPEYSRTLALIQSDAEAEKVKDVGDDTGAYR